MDKNKLYSILLILIIGSPFIIGIFLPKTRIVEEKIMIDKMYFFILSDVTNHWEESAWRTNLDTIIQKDDVDGLEAWMEYYQEGDSVLLLTQLTAENDYIRIIVEPDGHQRTRSITMIDVMGKTAVRLAEEVYTPNPVERFIQLFVDAPRNRAQTYLNDLAEKNKVDPNAEEEVVGW